MYFPLNVSIKLLPSLVLPLVLGFSEHERGLISAGAQALGTGGRFNDLMDDSPD